VRLPIRGLLDLCQRRPFGPSDQFQDLGTLALSARGVLASLAGAGLAFLPALASFLGAALILPPLAAFWPLGAPFFWVAPFFEEAFSGATCAPCSATVAAFSVILASAFVMGVAFFLRLVGA
jgi:hypothetical protein